MCFDSAISFLLFLTCVSSAIIRTRQQHDVRYLFGILIGLIQFLEFITWIYHECGHQANIVASYLIAFVLILQDLFCTWIVCREKIPPQPYFPFSVVECCCYYCSINNTVDCRNCHGGKNTNQKPANHSDNTTNDKDMREQQQQTPTDENTLAVIMTTEDEEDLTTTTTTTSSTTDPTPTTNNKLPVKEEGLLGLQIATCIASAFFVTGKCHCISNSISKLTIISP
jgi:hypothetical protein